MAAFERLCSQLHTYLKESEVAHVARAYRYAKRAHGAQARNSGEPYIVHPVAVAQILADMRMDHRCLMAALLHDVIEDTTVGKTTLGNRFGKQVAELVDGVSKLGTVFKSRDEAQAQNFHKMAMAMSKDMRVMLIKLADRLHNMRTLEALSTDRRRRIARETLDLYAPIANRLGMHSIKIEFEDLSFRALYPMRERRIRAAVGRARGHRKELVRQVQETLKQCLRDENIDADVIGREKHMYSIYSKMLNHRRSFGEIMDVFGFRILVDKVDTCYRTLGVVHNLYKPVANRFKDYIAIPKVNGYQSLHTTLFGLDGIPIEIQIRTRDMEAVATHGIASHRLYKSGSTDSDARVKIWVKDLLELQQSAGDPRDFLDNFKHDLFTDEVYVFTPKGDIMELPTGATAVDFAFAVHTDVGNTCVACYIDRNLEPLSTVLSSGQTVEVVTAPEAQPNPAWLDFVVTGKARAGIRHALKHMKRSESVSLGRMMLNRVLQPMSLRLDDIGPDSIARLLAELELKQLDDLLEQIALGTFMPYVIATRLTTRPSDERSSDPGREPLEIRGDQQTVLTYARCCRPIPGDPIVGHLSAGRGLVVHVETCSNLRDVRRTRPREIIGIRWHSEEHGEFHVDLKVQVNRHRGMFAEIASAVSSAEGSVESMGLEERDAMVSVIKLRVLVRDRVHLARVMRRIRQVSAVSRVQRMKS